AAHHSCLPVLDGTRLCGIFTATDALRFASAALEDDDRVRRHAPEVAQLMTPRPLVVAKQTTTLVSAWQMMRANHVRHLPVLADGNVVGILSDRDVLAAGREALREQTLQPPMVVADAMSTRLSTIEADRPATEAAAILLRRRVGALAVMRKSELRGIITVSDFMYWILARA
ncbi:MAG TPA: CBS domain-containing protein, partial [Polyangia bacterium]